MNKDLKTILIISILLVLIDSFYLKTVSNYFNKQVIKVQYQILNYLYLPQLFALFLIFGLYFIIKDNKPILDDFLLGLVIYMVFETTNKAIF